MKKYIVECVYIEYEYHGHPDEVFYDYSMWDNFIGDYIKADNPEEALEVAMECLVDLAAFCGDSSGRILSDQIIFYNDNEEPVSEYSRFEVYEIVEDKYGCEKKVLCDI